MKAEFHTLPKDERPLAVNRKALKKMRIGPIFASDPNALVGMRGVPDPLGTLRRWSEYRVIRRRRRLAANASRAANR